MTERVRVVLGFTQETARLAEKLRGQLKELPANSIRRMLCRLTSKITVDREDYEIHLKRSPNGQKSDSTIESDAQNGEKAFQVDLLKWICKFFLVAPASRLYLSSTLLKRELLLKQ